MPSERIKALFDEGFQDPTTKEKETYRYIITGLAPGGCVVIWMKGAGHQVEIGRYQGEETDVDWNDFNPQGERKRKKYVKSILSRRPHTLKIIEEDRIDYEIWDTYRKRYNWRPRIELPERARLDIIFLYMINAEMDRLFDTMLIDTGYQKRAIPRKISFQWFDKDGQKYGSEYDFNEEEARQAFEEMYGDDPDQECELVFRVDTKELRRMSVHLRSKTEEIEFRGSRSYGSYTMRQLHKD